MLKNTKKLFLVPIVTIVASGCSVATVMRPHESQTSKTVVLSDDVNAPSRIVSQRETSIVSLSEIGGDAAMSLQNKNIHQYLIQIGNSGDNKVKFDVQKHIDATFLTHTNKASTKLVALAGDDAAKLVDSNTGAGAGHVFKFGAELLAATYLASEGNGAVAKQYVNQAFSNIDDGFNAEALGDKFANVTSSKQLTTGDIEPGEIHGGVVVVDLGSATVSSKGQTTANMMVVSVSVGNEKHELVYCVGKAKDRHCADHYFRFEDKAEFDQLVGKELVSKNASIELKANGTFVGAKMGQSVKGSWFVKDRELCTSYSDGPEAITSNVQQCHVVHKIGENIRLTKSDSTEKAAFYKL